MAYIRHDINCNPKSPQPGEINVVDTFGNTNDFFHIDYKRCDKDCNPNPIPFDPNNPQNTVHDNPDVLFFDTNWTRKLSNNSSGSKDQYIQNFSSAGTGIDYDPTLFFDFPIYLGSETDEDLVLVDEASSRIISVVLKQPTNLRGT